MLRNFKQETGVSSKGHPTQTSACVQLPDLDNEYFSNDRMVTVDDTTYRGHLSSLAPKSQPPAKSKAETGHLST